MLQSRQALPAPGYARVWTRFGHQNRSSRWIMKAAVLREVDRPLEVEEVQLDDPGPREVLIRTGATGVCHSDLHFIEGKYSIVMPAVLGHEAAGTVEAVGSQVTYLRPGDTIRRLSRHRAARRAHPRISCRDRIGTAHRRSLPGPAIFHGRAGNPRREKRSSRYRNPLPRERPD